MNGDPLKRPVAGQPFRPSASRENAFIDAANWVRQQQRRGGAVATPGRSPTPAIVTVKNTGGSDVARFGVLAVDDILFDPTDNLDGFKNNPVLTVGGGVPGKPFLVALEPIENGKIGRAMALGVTPVKINVLDEGDAHADAENAARLKSGSSGGVPILWKEAGTGEKWGVVLLGGGGGKGCTPDHAGTGVVIGAGTTEAPGSAVWFAGGVGGVAGVEVHAMTRAVYKTASAGGSEKLYGFKVILYFDSCGKLVKVSDETRFEIDNPDLC